MNFILWKLCFQRRSANFFRQIHISSWPLTRPLSTGTTWAPVMGNLVNRFRSLQPPCMCARTRSAPHRCGCPTVSSTCLTYSNLARNHSPTELSMLTNHSSRMKMGARARHSGSCKRAGLGLTVRGSACGGDVTMYIDLLSSSPQSQTSGPHTD